MCQSDAFQVKGEKLSFSHTLRREAWEASGTTSSPKGWELILRGEGAKNYSHFNRCCNVLWPSEGLQYASRPTVYLQYYNLR
jgi:hypothetical protein